MRRFQLSHIGGVSARVLPNRWDVIAFALIFGLLMLIAEGSREMRAPLPSVETALSLDPANLPGYALQTVLRMFMAMGCALTFTFVYASLAAKSKRAGMVMIPILDILQSVPVLGFISFTVAFFMGLFPGSSMGAELAAIFAIFTSQAWNMTFSFYYALKTLPPDLVEVARACRFSAWRRFWTLEAPFAMPGLVWNAMISMSGGWFFVVAAEAITVGDTTVTLPGIGSYVALAIKESNLTAIYWAIATMFVVILIYDQLIFRPLVAWSEKFRFELTDSGERSQSWVLTLLARTRLLQQALAPMDALAQRLLAIRLPDVIPPAPAALRHHPRIMDTLWIALLIATSAYGAWLLFGYLSASLSLKEAFHAVALGTFTLLRIIVLIALVSLIWVPIGVWIGLHPRASEKIQPLVQFAAAFPANLLFPAVVAVIAQFNLNPSVWLSPLIVLGTQWYILFNVIAGASVFPGDLKEAAASFRLKGRQWWMKVILPGIFPYYITGAIAACGGSWNASIVAEMVTWGNTTYRAEGIGSYIAEATVAGDYPRIVLGICVMTVFVLLLNRLFWHRLTRFAEERFRLS